MSGAPTEGGQSVKGNTVADQKELWNRIHGEGGIGEYGIRPSDFALKVAPRLEGSVRLLELGCGAGGDAVYFAEQGHMVTATDFSQIAIERAAAKPSDVDFQVLDIGEEFPFADGSFDIVYANLSLHYANDAGTRAIFGRIAQVLADDGRLLFRCKSIYSEFEKMDATEIAPNVWDKRGHVRHLFSTDYVEDVTNGLFRLVCNEYTTGGAYGYESYFVEAEAVKR